ncbi:MAG: phospholipase D-like domain-containing protein, partial [Candidatus Bipolaricaulia bacterium]
MKKALLLFALLLLLASQAGCQPASPPPEGLSVYFNDPLAGLPRMDRPAAQAGELKGRLLELLNSAKRKIDAAVYSISDRDVISALRGACSRRVRLRIVTEAEEYHGQLEGPSCLELRLDGNERLMHDKFMIVDQETVWTGSANWTPGSFYYDANNALEIRDRDLARAYELEFSQMFRSGRYGPEKEDNNDEEFEVAGTAVEAYFPPSDRPEGVLLRLIGAAKERIEIAMFYLTDGALSSALAS